MKKGYVPYLLLLPAFALIIIFKYFPFITGISGSLFSNGNDDGSWGRFENYLYLFSNKEFWNSMAVTIKFCVILVAIQIIVAIFMAILINAKVWGVIAFRTVVFLPIAISTQMTAIIFGILLNPGNGAINGILRFFGIAAQPFLTSDKQALLCIIIICTWKGVSYWAMYLLAGLQQIPEALYEASRIDGCNRIKDAWYITMPLMKRTITFVLVSDTIINMFLFSPMYLLTNGGPRSSTNVLMYEAYRQAFSYANMSHSYAIVTILLLMVSIVVAVEFFLFKSDT